MGCGVATVKMKFSVAKKCDVDKSGCGLAQRGMVGEAEAKTWVVAYGS